MLDAEQGEEKILSHRSSGSLPAFRPTPESQLQTLEHSIWSSFYRASLPILCSKARITNQSSYIVRRQRLITISISHSNPAWAMG
jgi:hypothetical protein